MNLDLFHNIVQKAAAFPSYIIYVYNLVIPWIQFKYNLPSWN